MRRYPTATAIALHEADPPGADAGRHETFANRAPLARRAPWLLRLLLRAAARQAARNPDKAAGRVLEDLPPADARIMADPTWHDLHVRTTGEILSRPASMATEMRLLARPWGIDVAAVDPPVTIWVGAADTTRPPAMARRLAALLPGDVPVTVVPQAATFGLLPHFAGALRFVTT